MEVPIAEQQIAWLQDSAAARFNVLYGGASSGKSWTLAAYLVSKMYKLDGIGIGVFRKTKPSIRQSCLRLVSYWLNTLHLPYKINKSELVITAPNGSFLQFGGLDDVEKLKSIEGLNYVWIEEATEIGEKDLLQLHIRCRAKNPYEPNQFFISFNPVDPVGNAWLKGMTDLAPTGTYLKNFQCRVLMVTHLDNPMLDPEQHAAIEGLADADEEFNKIYRLGQWATPQFIIYQNWDIIDEFPAEKDLDDIGYGLDFGYVNPSSLLRIGHRENDVYVDELLYESKVHNADLIGRMGTLIRGNDRNRVIIADSAEPAYIDEIAAAGYNIHPVVKAPGQAGKSFVQTGIDRVKRMNLHITARSADTIKEIRGYKWKRDKDDNVLPEPVKFLDHAMDALRYYLHSLVGDYGEAETIVVSAPDWF